MATASCYGMPANTVARRASKPCAAFEERVKFRVRSMNQENEKIKEQAAGGPPKPTLTPKPQVLVLMMALTSSTYWPSVGQGRERINGRLAMIGFVTAMGVELAKGQDIFSQVQNGGIPWFLGTSVLLSLASLIPMFQGVSAESKSGNLMTSDAELWNGRFAMLGLVALAFTEYVKVAPLCDYSVLVMAILRLRCYCG